LVVSKNSVTFKKIIETKKISVNARFAKANILGSIYHTCITPSVIQVFNHNEKTSSVSRPLRPPEAVFYVS
jgi:hypothetical protein